MWVVFFAFLCISRKCRRETKTVLVASCRSETKEFLVFFFKCTTFDFPPPEIDSVFFTASFSFFLLSVLVGGNDDYHRGRRYYLSFFEGLFGDRRVGKKYVGQDMKTRIYISQPLCRSEVQ